MDIATEFSALIVAQRGYEANARTITTFDQIMQDTINLKPGLKGVVTLADVAAIEELQSRAAVSGPAVAEPGSVPPVTRARGTSPLRTFIRNHS